MINQTENLPQSDVIVLESGDLQYLVDSTKGVLTRLIDTTQKVELANGALDIPFFTAVVGGTESAAPRKFDPPGYERVKGAYTIGDKL